MSKNTAGKPKSRTKPQKPSALDRHQPASSGQASSSQPKVTEKPKDLETTMLDREEYIRQSLLGLGAPDISLGDMRRLCKGPLADVLLFVAEHIRGRAEVTKARVRIQQMREAGRAGNNDGQPSEWMRAKHAGARLQGAKNDFNEAQRQLDERLQSVSRSQREMDDLQAKLDSKRRVRLLLQVLEKKETFRSSRIDEVDRLLQQLQAEISTTKHASIVLADSEATTSTKRVIRPVKAEHTQDVLAALHAYHIRLPHSVPPSHEPRHGSETRRTAAEDRLRAAISALSTPDDPDDLYERCEQLARHRAERRMQYRSPLSAPTSRVTEDDLDGMHERIIQKEGRLQSLINDIHDLEQACTLSVQSLATFEELTKPALRQSLEDEAKAVEGYVDVLRLSILHGGKDQGHHQEAIVPGKSWQEAFRDVRGSIERAHERNTFLREATLLVPSALDPAAAQIAEQLISSHRERQAAVDEHNTSLLARKLEKVKFGDTLGDQIERLLAEREVIAAMSGSSK